MYCINKSVGKEKEGESTTKMSEMKGKNRLGGEKEKGETKWLGWRE